MILVNTVPNPKSVAPKLQKLYNCKVSINVARQTNNNNNINPARLIVSSKSHMATWGVYGQLGVVYGPLKRVYGPLRGVYGPFRGGIWATQGAHVNYLTAGIKTGSLHF